MTSTDLRIAASRIEQAEAVESWCPDLTPDKVNVQWSSGSACGGYKQISAAISEIVTERFEELRKEAIRRAREEADRRIASLRGTR